MNRMWSPWRNKYIQSFKEKKEGDSDCIFCNAVTQNSNDEDSLVVFHGVEVFVVMNLYPYNNGHLMVVPNRHINDFLDLSKSELDEINHLLKISLKALREILKPQGFNVGMNIGKVAGAGIDTHLHYHAVPRWNGDTNFMPALGEVKVISQDLLQTKTELIKAFDKLL